jgi:hypothetical protein
MMGMDELKFFQGFVNDGSALREGIEGEVRLVMSGMDGGSIARSL